MLRFPSHIAFPLPVTHYLHQDHLGSTSLVTTAGGVIAGASFHAPFGAPWHATGSLAAAPRPPGASTSGALTATDYRYTGQRSFEASLGSLYHYQARWYSPVLGRFLAPDPIVPEPGNPQAFNRYAYVYNNPYRYTDPRGHCPFCIAAAFVVLAVAGNTAVDVAIDYSIAQLTGDDFHLGQSLAVNAAINTGLVGVGGIIGKARHLRHGSQLIDAGKAWRSKLTGAGKVPGLSAESLETIRRWGIKPHHLLKPRKGFHRHHLVEKRFWRQLGFESKEQAEKDILSAFLDAKTHGPNKDQPNITGRLRELIPYGDGKGRTGGATLQEIWDAHKRVYEEFDLDDLAEVVWDKYFRHFDGVTK